MCHMMSSPDQYYRYSSAQLTCRACIGTDAGGESPHLFLRQLGAHHAPPPQPVADDHMVGVEEEVRESGARNKGKVGVECAREGGGGCCRSGGGGHGLWLMMAVMMAVAMVMVMMWGQCYGVEGCGNVVRRTCGSHAMGVSPSRQRGGGGVDGGCGRGGAPWRGWPRPGCW